ncbi:MAG: DNA repair protein RecO [Azospirillaceae bacterium]|nr:DNA repair protein RecO [Azospirillaceae bacterium]
MDWRDDAIVLALRRQGESSAVVTVLSRDHGRHAGWLRGARDGRPRGGLEPGTLVQARWRGRLAEQLGVFVLEAQLSHAAALLDDPLRLAALSAACAVCERALPEHQPHPGAFAGLSVLLAQLPGPVWAAAYVQWEVAMLRELGYGLDLSACAITGGHDDLAYVSPRSGRAVSAAAAAPWRDRLLALPRFLVGRGDADAAAILDGLALTGHFLARHLGETAGVADLPAARSRFAQTYRKMMAKSGSVPPHE